jgi:hypothetical protein
MADAASSDLVIAGDKAPSVSLSTKCGLRRESKETAEQ